MLLMVRDLCVCLLFHELGFEYIGFYELIWIYLTYIVFII